MRSAWIILTSVDVSCRFVTTRRGWGCRKATSWEPCRFTARHCHRTESWRQRLLHLGGRARNKILEHLSPQTFRVDQPGHSPGEPEERSMNVPTLLAAIPVDGALVVSAPLVAQQSYDGSYVTAQVKQGGGTNAGGGDGRGASGAGGGGPRGTDGPRAGGGPRGEGAPTGARGDSMPGFAAGGQGSGDRVWPLHAGYRRRAR